MKASLTHTHINMYRHICAFPRRDMHIQRAAVEGRQHLTGSLIIPTLLHLLIQLPLLSAQWKTGGTAAESFLRTTQPLTWEKGETASEKSRGITSQWQMSKKKKMGRISSDATFSLLTVSRIFENLKLIIFMHFNMNSLSVMQTWVNKGDKRWMFQPANNYFFLVLRPEA